MNTQTVSLNLSKAKAVGQIARIGQADSEGTTIEAHVYDGATPANLSEATATFCMRLPDGTHFVEDGNCTISGNVVTYVVDEEHCAVVEGYTDEAYFRIDKGGSTYSTARFRAKVLRAASSGASVPESYSSEVEELIDELDDAIETATDAANVANAAAANADATADGVESRVQEMAQDAAETATADAEQRIQDAIDAMGDISELAVPLMSKDIRGGAKLEEHGGLVLRDESLGIGSLVQESDGAVRGGIAGLTAEGHAEQVATTGKNLARANQQAGGTSTNAGITWTLLSDGRLNVVGTSTEQSFASIGNWSLLYITNALSAGSYVASVTDSRFGIRVGKGTESSFVASGTGQVRFTVDSESVYAIGVFLPASQTVNTAVGIQLEAGSTATAYEPYTGAAPSPSPEFPQTIEVVRGRNLYNASTATQYRDITSDGTIANSESASHYASDYMPIVSGQTYHQTNTGDWLGIGNAFYDASKNFLAFISGNNIIKNGYVFTAPPNAAYVRATAVGDDFQLERGSVATPYVPYGHVGMEVQGKNLLQNIATSKVDGGVTFTVNKDGSVTANGTATGTLYYRVSSSLNIVVGNKYTLSGCPSGGSGEKYWLYVYTGVQNAFDFGNGFTFTATRDTAFVDIVIKPGFVCNNLTFYPQLELGPTATEYQPYFEPTCTPIPLPSRGWVGSLPDGTADVLTLDGAGKVTWELKDEEVVLDGSSDEGWNASGNYMSTGGGFYQLYIPRYVAKSTAENHNPGLMCEEASWAELGASTDNTGKIGCMETASGSTFRFRLYEESSQNLNNFRAYLAEHPITCMFALTTPVTEDCGYVEDWPTDIPEGAVISIPELDAVNIEYFIDSTVTELARQWYERAQSEYGDRIAALEEAVAEIIAG